MNNEQNNVQNGLGTTESVNQVNVSPVENNLGQNIPVQPLNNEGKKKNTGFNITLVILGLLIVLGIILGILWFVKGSTKNVYYQAIDNLADNAVVNIENIEEELNKPLGVNASISANLTTSDINMKTLANLLNKMKINMNIELDYNNKLSNITYDIKYNNDSLVKADLILNNNNAYLDLNNLYNKVIKLPDDTGIDYIWQNNNFDSYKTIVKEMANIIKASLKEDYFTVKDTKVNNVNTKVYILTLTGKDMYNFKLDIINNMLDNQNLINALNTITKTDIKQNIESIKNNITETNDTFTSEIYINKSTHKLENAIIKINNGTIELNKTDTDKFDIILDSNDNRVNLGYIIISDNNFTISLKDTGVDITIETKKENNKDIVNLNFEAYGTYIKLNLERQDKTGKVTMTLSNDNNFNLTLNMDYTLNQINKVTSKNVSNYIELNQMTENDYNTIMQNLYQNNTLMTLIQSFTTI